MWRRQGWNPPPELLNSTRPEPISHVKIWGKEEFEPAERSRVIWIFWNLMHHFDPALEWWRNKYCKSIDDNPMLEKIDA